MRGSPPPLLAGAAQTLFPPLLGHVAALVLLIGQAGDRVSHALCPGRNAAQAGATLHRAKGGDGGRGAKAAEGKWQLWV